MSRLPPSIWDISLARAVPGEDLVCVGGDLQPGTVLNAYARGLFPMRLGDGPRAPLGWWSPDPRAVLRRGDFHASRSLRRSERGFRFSIDRAFGDVMAGCGDPSRPHGWITQEFVDAYTLLHRLGWAHSVEVWQGGELVGGTYGLAIGGLFAAESKFHRVTDASKAAVHALVGWWFSGDDDGARLIDVQWQTEHLASLGVAEVPRAEYVRLLGRALAAGGPGPEDVPGPAEVDAPEGARDASPRVGA